MTQPHTRPLYLSPDEATLDAADSETPPTRRGCPHVALVEGSGPAMSCETQQLLRARLRAAALILFMGFAVFLVWRLLAPSPEEMLGSDRGSTVLLVGHVLVTLVLGGCGVMLCRRCNISTGLLRGKELVIFGLPAAFFLLLQHERMIVCAAREFLPSPVSLWFLLMFTYAMFIPNTWRRAAVAISAMATAPLVMTVFLWSSDRACASVLDADPNLMAHWTLTMLIAGIASVVGVHTIGSLRREAFEAKQLGQYRLRHRIGSGGMGEVYLAEHQMMKRPCAIKVIRPEKSGDPKALARFEREVRATAKLSHWNSIDIFDYGRTDDGTFYYVMEYLPGMNLQDIVTDHGPLPPERVIHLMRQTCDALSEAHQAGLVHRDIKPANILAAHRGGLHDVAKLLDFGLAKPLVHAESTQLTQEGAITGSPLYMSPEQAVGDGEPDARSDIYALGVVTYFLLTGQPPFNDDKALKVLLAHAHEEPVLPTAHDGSIPADLEQVVLRCLAKSPQDRFATAAELGAALAQCESAGQWTHDDAADWWRQREDRQPQAAATAAG